MINAKEKKETKTDTDIQIIYDIIDWLKITICCKLILYKAIC